MVLFFGLWRMGLVRAPIWHPVTGLYAMRHVRVRWSETRVAPSLTPPLTHGAPHVSVTAYMEPFRVRLNGATSCSG